MQPLAVSAVALVVIMLAGVSVTLIWARRRTQPLPGGMNRWQLHGCIPLGLSGLVLGAISRGSGRHLPRTRSCSCPLPSCSWAACCVGWLVQ